MPFTRCLAQLIRWVIAASGTQIRAGVLGRRQTSHSPQRQRALGGRGQLRVAAEEEQGQRGVLGGGTIGPGAAAP